MEKSIKAKVEISNQKKRIVELDILKTIAIIAMIIDHFTIIVYFSSGYNGWASYIFSNYNEINNSFINGMIHTVEIFQDSTFRLVCHYIFVTIFLTICGISCTLSHSNFKRAVKIISAGLIITLVTSVVSLVSGVELYILFGILSTIGVSVLIYEIIVRICDNKWLLLAIGVFIIIWGFIIKWWEVPYIYSIEDLGFTDVIKMILGYVAFGEDCFGLIPCTGVVLIGGFIGKTVYKNKESIIVKKDAKWSKPFTFISKNALWIYLLHQVVAIIIILCLYLICGYRF